VELEFPLSGFLTVNVSRSPGLTEQFIVFVPMLAESAKLVKKLVPVGVPTADGIPLHELWDHAGTTSEQARARLATTGATPTRRADQNTFLCDGGRWVMGSIPGYYPRGFMSVKRAQ
jgi:hypothetical protein